MVHMVCDDGLVYKVHVDIICTVVVQVFNAMTFEHH